MAVSNKFLEATGALSKVEDCYLTCNTEDHEWMRSGKVAGRGIGDRLKDHSAAAKNIGSPGSTQNHQTSANKF